MVCEKLVNESERVFPFANLSVPNGREAFVVIDDNSIFIGLNLQFSNNIFLDLMVEDRFHNLVGLDIDCPRCLLENVEDVCGFL